MLGDLSCVREVVGDTPLRPFRICAHRGRPAQLSTAALRQACSPAQTALQFNQHMACILRRALRICIQ